MREETKKRDLLLSLTLTLFLVSYHLLSSLLVSVCVLGYGWKRLDFDTPTPRCNPKPELHRRTSKPLSSYFDALRTQKFLSCKKELCSW